MLKERTREIIEEVKKTENLLIKSITDVDTLKYMDAQQLEGIKSMFNLMDHYCDLAEEYANVIDNQDRKLDRILEKLNKWDKA